jgi:predicted RNase H-like HicB family nuclease
MEYIAYLHKDKKSDYGVSFPDFPGCITAGSTLKEAYTMASQALAMHVAGMRQDRHPVPEPSLDHEMPSGTLGKDFHSSIKLSCQF